MPSFAKNKNNATLFSQTNAQGTESASKEGHKPAELKKGPHKICVVLKKDELPAPVRTHFEAYRPK